MEFIAKAKEVVDMINDLMDGEEFDVSIVNVAFFENTVEAKISFKRNKEKKDDE